MNDNAIKNYAMWARRELISEVAKKCSYWGIGAEGCPAANADSIDGRVLTAQQKQQRADLLKQMKEIGLEQLVETAAYTWFNRILAIRFMETNDRLPSHVRMLSAQDGTFAPQALREALDLPLEALDTVKAAEFVQSGDDESLFKLVFFAQCDQLAEYMPAVFDRIGGAMELLLPDGLLRNGGVIEQLVSSIPEQDWLEGVEIIGWMYQYYVSERKDEVFASFKKGKKAEREAIAPATQLFTPNWIVRYLTENSLGRLWVLNKPDSSLPEHMPYFITPGEDAETEFKKVSSPEEITVVDPACGSGHILVYAFELLAKIYEEAGYSDREAAKLIVQKNLSGFEIDPRAAAMASFAVTMKACELDSRFLRRGVVPRITVLSRVDFEVEEKALLNSVAKNTTLIDVAAHLDECGSLFKPSQNDLDNIARDLASLAGSDSLFAVPAVEKLERLQDELQPLAERYDVVVANPPYMGGSNMNKWVSNWVKGEYPNAKRDLCTCFMERALSMLEPLGYEAMITASSWMFISSFETFRRSLLSSGSIASMIQQSTHGYAGVTVPTTMFVFAKDRDDLVGTYIRLEDFDRPQWQEPRALEALANPECGWCYRCSTESYAAVPGSPIAYWATQTMIDAFNGLKLVDYGCTRQGFATGNNDRFLRLWWEVSNCKTGFGYGSRQDAAASNKKWFPCNKGGGFRKWYGNNEVLANWENDGKGMASFKGSVIRNPSYYFKQGLTWGTISSAQLTMRFSPKGSLFESKGAMCYLRRPGDCDYVLAALNSSCAMAFLQILCPTLDFHEGPVGNIPIVMNLEYKPEIEGLVASCLDDTKTDWDDSEKSWDFRKHPLV